MTRVSMERNCWGIQRTLHFSYITAQECKREYSTPKLIYTANSKGENF